MVFKSNFIHWIDKDNVNADSDEKWGYYNSEKNDAKRKIKQKLHILDVCGNLHSVRIKLKPALKLFWTFQKTFL